MPITKAEFMRGAFSDMPDDIHQQCYDAILIGDLHEVARLIGMEATQGILDHEADDVLESPLMDLEKVLDDRDRAKDINETNRS